MGIVLFLEKECNDVVNGALSIDKRSEMSRANKDTAGAPTVKATVVKDAILICIFWKRYSLFYDCQSFLISLVIWMRVSSQTFARSRALSTCRTILGSRYGVSCLIY